MKFSTVSSSVVCFLNVFHTFPKMCKKLHIFSSRVLNASGLSSGQNLTAVLPSNPIRQSVSQSSVVLKNDTLRWWIRTKFLGTRPEGYTNAKPWAGVDVLIS